MFKQIVITLISIQLIFSTSIAQAQSTNVIPPSYSSGLALGIAMSGSNSNQQTVEPILKIERKDGKISLYKCYSAQMCGLLVGINQDNIREIAVKLEQGVALNGDDWLLITFSTAIMSMLAATVGILFGKGVITFAVIGVATFWVGYSASKSNANFRVAQVLRALDRKGIELLPEGQSALFEIPSIYWSSLEQYAQDFRTTLR